MHVCVQKFCWSNERKVNISKSRCSPMNLNVIPLFFYYL